MNWVNHREMNSILICCHFKKKKESFFSITQPFVWCVTAVKDMKNMDHLITFTASLPWLPIIHFRPIRWVRPAPQWGPSSSCRFSSTYYSYTRLFTHTAFEWYSFPQALTFVPQPQLSDTGNNTTLLPLCRSPTLSCYRAQSKTFW